MTTKLEIPGKIGTTETGLGEKTVSTQKVYDYLVKKYGGTDRQPSASLEFDRFGERMGARVENWHNRLLTSDMTISVLMNSRITPDDVQNLLKERERIEEALTEVPVQADLETGWGRSSQEKVKALLDSMDVNGVGLAKMTKILCLKRPKLIPMLDSYVIGALFKSEWPPVEDDTYAEAGIMAMTCFRELLILNLEAIETLTCKINDWLANHPQRPPLVLSNIRILETVLWGEWGGWENYD